MKCKSIHSNCNLFAQEALFIFSSWHLEYNGLSIKWLAKINQRSNWLSFVRIDRFAPNILWTAEAAKQAFSYRGAVMWNGLENELKDEINVNTFNSALSLPWTGDCLEEVVIELLLVIYYVMYILGQFLCNYYRIVFLIYRYILSISVVSLNKIQC